MKRERIWVVVLMAGGVVGISGMRALAGAIGAGDVLVYQVSGTALGLESNAAAVSILDIAGNTTVAQTFNISGMSSPLYSTTAQPVEDMALSANGTEVSFMGWTEPGTSGPLGETGGIPRGVGTLNAAGVYAQPAVYAPSTGALVLEGGLDQPHGAYSSDGSNWYMGSTTGMYSDVLSIPDFKAPGPLGGSDGTLAVKGFGGVTYALHTLTSTDIDGTLTASTLSIVTPTTPGSGTLGITFTPVITLPAAAHDFSMVSSQNNGVYDMLYVTTSSGISKFGLVGGVWTAEGTDASAGVEGIAAGPRNGGGAELYVTVDNSITGASTLDSIEDNAGVSAAINGSTPFVKYTAPAGDALDGVSLAPVPEAGTLGVMGIAGALVMRRRRES